MIICRGPQQGSVTQDFFFFKAKAVFTAGTENPGIKQDPNSDGPESVPAARFPPLTLSQILRLRGKFDLPMALSAAPQTRAVATLPVTAGCCRARGHRANPALGRQNGFGVSWKDRTYHIPLKALPNLLSRALLHKSYLTSRAEFPHRHSLHSHGQAEECLG